MGQEHYTEEIFRADTKDVNLAPGSPETVGKKESSHPIIAVVGEQRLASLQVDKVFVRGVEDDTVPIEEVEEAIGLNSPKKDKGVTY